jgi:phospholipid-binding lipoprotein MlaA
MQRVDFEVTMYMRIAFWYVLIILFIVMGCAHSPVPAASGVQPDLRTQDQIAKTTPESAATQESTGLDLSGDYQESDESSPSVEGLSGDGAKSNVSESPTPKLSIADPLEPFNRAMFQFNDKLYFWVLKPVAQGYKKVVHEDVRVVVKNFFTNAAFPVRFVNCLLQGNITGAAGEVGRFALNTLVGFGGLFDPASEKEINLASHKEDLGQTLGVYGIGQGFYIHWPLFGPSSPRDTVGMVGDGFLNPFSYLNEWYESAGMRSFDMINDASFRIGDYETLKKAAFDPYVAVRDAYVQYRFSRVNSREGLHAPTKDNSRKP